MWWEQPGKEGIACCCKIYVVVHPEYLHFRSRAKEESKAFKGITCQIVWLHVEARNTSYNGMTVLLWIIISSSQDMDNQTECDKHYTTLTANPPQTPLPFSNLDLITQTHLLPFSSIYSSASLRLQKKKINFIWAPQRCRYSLSIANCKIKAEVSSMQCMITCSCGIPALNHLSFSVIQVFQTKQVTSKYFLTYMDLLFLVGFFFFFLYPSSIYAFLL